jgi:hypothetical protein
LSYLFKDPENGDFSFNNVPEAAQIIALKAGMTTPVRRWASRPTSKEDAVNKMLTNKLIDIELF